MTPHPKDTPHGSPRADQPIELFRLLRINGHWVARVRELNLLIDTGSPFSFGPDVVLPWRGRSVRLRPGFADLEAVSAVVGLPLHGLVGMDLLSEVPFRLDGRAGCMVLGSPAEGPGSLSDLATRRGARLHEVPVDSLMRIPVVTCRVDGLELQAFLDSGAVMSYFPAPADPARVPVGRLADFLPTLGGLKAFEADVHLREVRVGGLCRRGVPVAAVPDVLRQVGLLAGVSGILAWPGPGMALAELRMEERRLVVAEAR